MLPSVLQADVAPGGSTSTSVAGQENPTGRNSCSLSKHWRSQGPRGPGEGGVTRILSEKPSR